MAQFTHFGERKTRKVYERFKTIVLNSEITDKKKDFPEQVVELTKKYLEMYHVPVRNLAVDISGAASFASLLASKIGTGFIQCSFAAKASDLPISKSDHRKAL